MQRFTKIIAAMLLTVAAVCVAGCNKDGGSGSGSGNNENNDTDVRVTTYTPQYITATTAKCGGDVIVTQGLTLTEFGVCWSKDRNPIAENLHLFTSNWSEPYVCTITDLEPSTKYYVRAYALRGLEYYYGEEKSFITESVGGGLDNHTWVDLGLPSGILWATCNVGACSPEDFGDYFSWGETVEKSTYSFGTYKYCKGDYDNLTKYCSRINYGYDDYSDNLTVLEAGDDAATVNWGDNWRTPTFEEWTELCENTFSNWTTQNGVTGQLFIASNGNFLFLPAAGYKSDNNYIGYNGIYWSSSLYNSDYPYYASVYSFYSDDNGMAASPRNCGQSVRAVLSAD